MAKQVMRDQQVWLGGYDLTGVINSLATDYGSEARDVATLGENTRIQLAGLRTLSATLEGYLDTAGGIDEELFNRIGLHDAPFSFAAVDAAEGDVAYTFEALWSQYSPGAAIGEVLAFSGAAQAGGSTGLQRGTLMHPRASEAVTGNGTARQLGAVSANQKLYGALHVLAGSGTLDLVVESDDAGGFGTPTTQMTFAQQTGIGFDLPLPVSGPITDDFWRLSWTIGGGPFTFVCILAIQ